MIEDEPEEEPEGSLGAPNQVKQEPKSFSACLTRNASLRSDNHKTIQFSQNHASSIKRVISHPIFASQQPVNTKEFQKLVEWIEKFRPVHQCSFAALNSMIAVGGAMSLAVISRICLQQTEVKKILTEHFEQSKMINRFILLAVWTKQASDTKSIQDRLSQSISYGADPLKLKFAFTALKGAPEPSKEEIRECESLRISLVKTIGKEKVGKIIRVVSSTINAAVSLFGKWSWYFILD